MAVGNHCVRCHQARWSCCQGEVFVPGHDSLSLQPLVDTIANRNPFLAAGNWGVLRCIRACRADPPLARLPPVD